MTVFLNFVFSDWNFYWMHSGIALVLLVLISLVKLAGFQAIMSLDVISTCIKQVWIEIHIINDNLVGMNRFMDRKHHCQNEIMVFTIIFLFFKNVFKSSLVIFQTWDCSLWFSVFTMLNSIRSIKYWLKKVNIRIEISLLKYIWNA